jgi:putative AdoMet-dependent methyltransferase
MTDNFASKADDWDVSDIPRQLSAAIGTCILENVNFHPRMEVMDFGAGTGLISAHVAPLVNRIIAVDISSAMLDKLVAKPELAGKVVAACQDIMDTPLDAQFDLIMSAMAMHHVDDTDKMIKRFAEHLKPGALIALADLDREDGRFHPENTAGVFHSGFDREVFQSLLEKHGFSNVRFVTAHTVNKEGRQYPVFLALASYHQD